MHIYKACLMLEHAAAFLLATTFSVQDFDEGLFEHIIIFLYGLLDLNTSEVYSGELCCI